MVSFADHVWLVFLLAIIVPALAQAQLTFKVSFDSSIRQEPATGRLVVYLGPGGMGARDPTEGVLFAAANPIYAVNVTDLKPGETIIVGDTADGYPCKPSLLPEGKYAARAVLDLHRESGLWEAEKGNLTSEVVKFSKPSDMGVVEIKLSQEVDPGPDPQIPGVELFTIRSKKLSDFAGRDVIMRAVVMFPRDFDSTRKYPVLYQIGGFGETYRDGFSDARRRSFPGRRDQQVELQRSTFEIYLDSDSPNGHTLFCDSDVNGPWGSALTQELIPALEARYPLVAKPEAHLLRGHSSGGWATVWLATEYPQVFGATWSSSPDPLDFHNFQKVNAYEWKSFFHEDGKTEPIFSYIRGGKVVTTIEQESLIENVIGPNRTGGQQWHAWQSCWGRRGPDGNARALYDPLTGVIDHEEAESYRRFDVVDRLKKNPARFAPIFQNNVRLVVGGIDNWDLDKPVARLAAELAKFAIDGHAGEGYIKIVPGLDHFSIFGSREIRSFPGEMLAHLRRHGLAAPATQPADGPATAPAR